MFSIFSIFNGFVAARTAVLFETTERVFVVCVVLTLRWVAVRLALAGAGVRRTTLFVEVREFVIGVVKVRLTTLAWFVLVAVLAFFCCDVSDFVPDATERFVDALVETVVDCVLFAVRATSVALSANVVWDTDKPRHTVKNSIILFIPFYIY